jgi:hypothetical protein
MKSSKSDLNLGELASVGTLPFGIMKGKMTAPNLETKHSLLNN